MYYMIHMTPLPGGRGRAPPSGPQRTPGRTCLIAPSRRAGWGGQLGPRLEQPDATSLGS